MEIMPKKQLMDRIWRLCQKTNSWTEYGDYAKNELIDRIGDYAKKQLMTEYGDYAKKRTHGQNMEIMPNNELIDRIWRLCQK